MYEVTGTIVYTRKKQRSFRMVRRVAKTDGHRGRTAKSVDEALRIEADFSTRLIPMKPGRA